MTDIRKKIKLIIPMPDGLDLCEKIQGSQCLVDVSKKRRKGKGREHQRLNKIQLGWRDDSIINRS